MGKINMGRVILGGIVAGVVMDVLGFLCDGKLLGPMWDSGMVALGHPTMMAHAFAWFNVFGIVGGIFMIWLYAAARGTLGAGPKTAILVGLAVWVLGTLLPNASFLVVSGLFSKHLALYTTLGGVVETVAGMLAGAAVYKD